MLLRCRQHLFAWNKHQLVQLTLSMKAIYFPHQHWLFFYGPDAIFSQALMSETQLPSVTRLVPKPASPSILSRSGSSTSFFPEWWTSSQSLQEPLTSSAPGKIWVIIWLNRQGWRASHVAVVVKNPPPSAGGVRDSGLISMSGRLPGGGHGNPLQYSCLENPMDRGAWKAKSSTWLKRFSTHACMHKGWVVLKFFYLDAPNEAEFNCVCVIQGIDNFLIVIRYYWATWLLKYIYWLSLLSYLMRMSSSLPGGSQIPTLTNYGWYPLLLLLERKRHGKLTWGKMSKT